MRHREHGIEAERASMDRLRMEIRRAAGPFLLFMLLMAGGLLTGADILRNLAGNKPWIDYATYRIGFDNTKGVVPARAELRLAGVKAGSITGNDLVNGRAVLTVQVEKRYAPLYRDARVRIRPVTPLEDMYVDIESRGHRSAGELGEREILAAKHTISPVEVGTVLNVMDHGTRENAAALLNELGRGLDDRGRNLKWAFAQLGPFLETAERLTTALAARRTNLARLVHNFGGITAEMGDHDRQLAGFIRSADATLGELSRNDGPFAATLAELPGTLRTMRSSFAHLRRTEDRLDPALRSLQPVAESLPAALDALDDFSRDAQPALSALRPSVRRLRSLVRTLRPTSAALETTFTRLRPLAPKFDSITEKAEPEQCRTYIGQFLTRLMSITKFGQGERNYADARANVRLDFQSAGSLAKNPEWRVSQPCGTEGKGGNR